MVIILSMPMMAGQAHPEAQGGLLRLMITLWYDTGMAAIDIVEKLIAAGLDHQEAIDIARTLATKDDIERLRSELRRRFDIQGDRIGRVESRIDGVDSKLTTLLITLIIGLFGVILPGFYYCYRSRVSTNQLTLVCKRVAFGALPKTTFLAVRTGTAILH